MAADPRRYRYNCYSRPNRAANSSYTAKSAANIRSLAPQPAAFCRRAAKGRFGGGIVGTAANTVNGSRANPNYQSRTGRLFGNRKHNFKVG
jgi:hypothetical protein